MGKWEYLWECLYPDDAEMNIRLLCNRGDAGWELVCIMDQGPDYLWQAYLKRPLQEDDTET